MTNDLWERGIIVERVTDHAMIRVKVDAADIPLIDAATNTAWRMALKRVSWRIATCAAHQNGKRITLASAITGWGHVAYRDGDPWNCTRANLAPYDAVPQSEWAWYGVTFPGYTIRQKMGQAVELTPQTEDASLDVVAAVLQRRWEFLHERHVPLYGSRKYTPVFHKPISSYLSVIVQRPPWGCTLLSVGSHGLEVNQEGGVKERCSLVEAA